MMDDNAPTHDGRRTLVKLKPIIIKMCSLENFVRGDLSYPLITDKIAIRSERKYLILQHVIASRNKQRRRVNSGHFTSRFEICVCVGNAVFVH